MHATLYVTMSVCRSVGPSVRNQFVFSCFLSHFETYWDILRHFQQVLQIFCKFCRFCKFLRVFEGLRVFESLRVFKGFWEFLRVFTFSLTRARDLWRWPCLVTWLVYGLGSSFNLPLTWVLLSLPSRFVPYILACQRWLLGAQCV